MSTRGINVLHISDTGAQNLHALGTPGYASARAVFIDMWIGVTNGVDVARTLREQGDIRPFFLLTAGENPDPNELRQLNVVYLQKPANFNKVAKMVAGL
jgi:DNA-binding response OmpR family regulator